MSLPCVGNLNDAGLRQQHANELQTGMTIVTKRVLIARPRLDCSFKQGPVPAEEGPALNSVLGLFGAFIDNLVAFHQDEGNIVDIIKRPLWQLAVPEFQEMAKNYDRVYFPHKLKKQFPLGSNALYYKNSPIPEFMTVDPEGWGASLSFLPVEPDYSPEAIAFYDVLRRRIDANISLFSQPDLKNFIPYKDYLLFLCQLPHDETIQYHSSVSVETALEAVLDFAATADRRLVVKGHPANRRAMLPLKAMVDASPTATWIDDASIHTCISGASCVFTVNSGSGIEVMMHGKPLVHFGRAEYSSVTIGANSEPKGLANLDIKTVNIKDYIGFLYNFFAHTFKFDDANAFVRLRLGA